MLRGKVEMVKKLVISDDNTKKMRTMHTLYGNTKFTDEQIAYFYILWKGNHTQAALDLGCAPMTMWLRVHQLDKGPMSGIIAKFHGKKKRKPRSDAKVSPADFILVVKSSKSVRQAARILGINHNAVRMRAKSLGVKLPKGKRGRPKN